MDCKSIIFDLDGTLVDSYPGIEASARAAWEAVQPDSAFPSLRPFLGPPIREMFQRAKPELNEANLNLLVKAFREAYDGGGWKKTVPFAGVVETLTVLHKKRVPLFGVTNKPKLPTHLILENCGIHLFFRVFLSPDSRIPPFASKTEAITTLLIEHGLDPQSALLIGDTQEDAEAASQCGVTFIAFAGGYGWKTPSRDISIARICTRFEEILQIFQG